MTADETDETPRPHDTGERPGAPLDETDETIGTPTAIGGSGASGGDPSTQAAARRSPQAASVRALRMMNIVPWIAANDGPTVDEVCERFGVERSRLVEELKVLQFVGLPPYTPDMLTEVTFDKDRVWVRLPDVFSRPLRLTPDQALGLLAAGAALADASPADPGPLETGLAKLADLLGIDASEAVGIRLGQSDPEVLRALRQATAERSRVRLDYFTYGRDDRNEREVDPYRVFSDGGSWYLYGHCHLAGKPRLFRLDRIFGLDVLDVSFDRPADAEQVPRVFGAGPEAPRITLDLAPPARWVVDQYPVEGSQDLPNGHVRARLAISSHRWLEKLLLRLGPDAQLVETTDPDLADISPRAAQRVLARYR